MTGTEDAGAGAETDGEAWVSSRRALLGAADENGSAIVTRGDEATGGA